ncbi:MAG: hypothetical protein ACI3V0_09190, partial [Faecousia sp.]
MKAPSAISISQDVIDSFLRSGGNSNDHRMLIVAEFMKQKSIPEIAAILPKVFVGGHGLKFGSTDHAAWYHPDGIHLTYGRSARDSRRAQVISWEDAALRIGQLLEEGHFATNIELAEATTHERELLAQKLIYASRDAIGEY